MTESTQQPLDPAELVAPTPGSALSLGWLHPRGFARLGVVNFLLRLVTLGFYNFWGKTEVRRRLWSAIRLNGEPLVYAGTGGDMLRGFIAVFGLVFIPTMLIYLATAFAFDSASPAHVVVQGGMTLGYLFLYGLGTYRAQRYRMTRTSWRGIRGGVEGSAAGYAARYLGAMLLIIPTLGWIVPWRANMLQRHLTNDMRFGTAAFSYSGSAGPLYRRFWPLWVLMITLITAAGVLLQAVVNAYITQIDPVARSLPPALIGWIALIAFTAWVIWGVSSAWYRAGQLNHFARSTRLGGLTFDATVSGRGLVVLTILNAATKLAGGLIGAMLGAALTYLAVTVFARTLASTQPLGGLLSQAAIIGGAIGVPLFSPIVQARTTAYVVQSIRIDGGLDLASIGQHTGLSPGTGEGLAQAFDLDGL